MENDRWDEAARKEAEFANSQMREAHRGAYSREKDRIVVFGNDGYGHGDVAIREVEFVRENFGTPGARILGFGTSEDGYSWAMIITMPCIGLTEATDLVWAAWSRACDHAISEGRCAIQKTIAEGVIAKNVFLPAMAAN